MTPRRRKTGPRLRAPFHLEGLASIERERRKVDDTLVADLGPLEANRGDLNIEIPAGTDLSPVRAR